MKIQGIQIELKTCYLLITSFFIKVFPVQPLLACPRRRRSKPSIYSYFEKVSEKVHGTILKDIVGGFEFTIVQRNLEEVHERPRIYVCEC